MDALNTIGYIMGYCWDMLLFPIPGIGVTCQSFVAALLLIGLSVKIVHYAFGFGGSGSGYRSGHSSRKHISDNRKGDTH